MLSYTQSHHHTRLSSKYNRILWMSCFINGCDQVRAKYNAKYFDMATLCCVIIAICIMFSYYLWGQNLIQNVFVYKFSCITRKQENNFLSICFFIRDNLKLVSGKYFVLASIDLCTLIRFLTVQGNFFVVKFFFTFLHLINRTSSKEQNIALHEFKSDKLNKTNHKNFKYIFSRAKRMAKAAEKKHAGQLFLKYSMNIQIQNNISKEIKFNNLWKILNKLIKIRHFLNT